MPLESAHQFAVQINDEFGLNLSSLGVVMAETEKIYLDKIAPGIHEDLYTSTHPERFWIHGDISSSGAHITLLYGLVKPAYQYKGLVDHLLADVLPTHMTVSHVTSFASPYADEDYACLVAKIEKSEALVRSNDRLRYLPHVDTFPEWEPHVTLAYVRKDRAEHWIERLNAALDGRRLVIDHINYGKERL